MAKTAELAASNGRAGAFIFPGAECLTFQLTGLNECLFHSGQLANPKNEYAKAMKAITKKRNRTEEDMDELARLEFFGGLYTRGSEQDPDDLALHGGVIGWPGNNVKTMLVTAAKKRKLGKDFRYAIFCEEFYPFDDFAGPKDPAARWDEYADIRGVKVSTSTCMRCRPIFDDWTMTVSVHYLPQEVDRGVIIDVMHLAGAIIGLSDFRPEFGRFEAELIDG